MSTTPTSQRCLQWISGGAALWLLLLALPGMGSETSSWDVGYRRVFTNPEAVILPQCYTRTEGWFNPYHTCHHTHQPDPGRLNLMDDAHLQGAYAFSDIGLDNHWTKLFVDRRAVIAAISDAQIRAHVAKDNYTPTRRLFEPCTPVDSGAGFLTWPIWPIRNAPSTAPAVHAMAAAG